MNTIIQTLEKIGQSYSVKNNEEINQLMEKFNLNENDLNDLFKNNDLVCGFVPENDDDDSEDKTDENKEEEVQFI
jgi:hypothetical protein